MIKCYEYLIPFGDNLGLKDAQIFYEHVTRPGWLELAHREHLFISWASCSRTLRVTLPKGCTKGIPSGPSARIIRVYLRPLLPWNLWKSVVSV